VLSLPPSVHRMSPLGRSILYTADVSRAEISTWPRRSFWIELMWYASYEALFSGVA
jgi:hypothetical protein